VSGRLFKGGPASEGADHPTTAEKKGGDEK
jgi:hypothetical protein